MLVAYSPTRVRRTPGLLLALVLVACAGPRADVQATPAPHREPAPVPEPAPILEPAQVVAPRLGNPLQTLTPARADDEAFAGVVAEVLPAGGYTYLRVTTSAGDRWVATMGKGAQVGHRVQVKNMGTRHDFHSKRLGRRFDALAFGIVREA